MKNILVLFTLFLTACSSTGVIPMDDGIYMIAKRSAQVGFGPPDGVKADVYIEANQFCDKKNKKVKTVKLDMTNSGFAKPGNVSLEFKCEWSQLPDFSFITFNYSALNQNLAVIYCQFQDPLPLHHSLI